MALLPHVEERVDLGRITRVQVEARLLDWLASRALPFRVPRVVPSASELLVCEWMPGIPTDARSARGLEDIAAVARAVHDLTAPDFLPGFETRREHASRVVEALDLFDDPVVREAKAWAAEHLPPRTPATLLHGDLLAQNVFVHFDLPPALIDWAEASRGDPAQDLAIVTRGRRAPFGLPDGLERLVRAYDPIGERVTVAQVRLHELGLLAGWAFDATERPGEAVAQLRGLARRVIAGRSAAS